MQSVPFIRQVAFIKPLVEALLSFYSRVISIFVEIVTTTWNALRDYGLTVAYASCYIDV